MKRKLYSKSLRNVLIIKCMNELCIGKGHSYHSVFIFSQYTFLMIFGGRVC